MKPIQRKSILMLVLAAAFPGCVNFEPVSDATQFYVLSSQQPGRGISDGRHVLVRNIALADYLENSQIAQRTSPNRITYLSGHRWAGSLDRMIGRIIAEEISRNIPGISVTTISSGEADLYLDVSIFQFDFTPGSGTKMILEYAVMDASSRELLKRGLISHSETLPVDLSMEQVVGAMEKTLREGLKSFSLAVEAGGMD